MSLAPGTMDPRAPRYAIEGPMPSMHASYAVPAQLAQQFRIRAERFPAIIGGVGGCSCARVPASELTPQQVRIIGDWWQDFLRSDAGRVVQQAERGLDTVWQAVKPIVPYGDVIDTAHRARLDAMYGRQGAQSSIEPAVRSAQQLTRRARKGDSAAMAEMRRLKDAAAAGDARARRTWRIVVLVARADDARITAAASGSRTTSSSRASSSSSQPLAMVAARLGALGRSTGR